MKIKSKSISQDMTTDIELSQGLDSLKVDILSSHSVYSLLNNKSTPTSISNFIIDKSYSYYKFEYFLFRKTDTANSTRTQAGQLRFLFNNELNQWFISDDYVGQNAGVEFSVDSTGQIKYISTNVLGNNHIATLKISLMKRMIS